MNHEEFAFFNHQLAAMLDEGLPLEGSIEQLCRTLRTGRLRTEMTALRDDLAEGVPLDEAVARRKLPDVYVRMVALGARSGNLPGVLTRIADYYRETDHLWTRLKGLLTYPAIVLLASFGLSLAIVFVTKPRMDVMFQDMHVLLPAGYEVFAVGPPMLLGAIVAVAFATPWIPPFRRALSWMLSPFRYARLSQIASLAALSLRSGCTLAETVLLLRELESESRAGRELDRWAESIRHGAQRWTDIAISARVFPPLFLWLVNNGGEAPASGFDDAAEVYRERSRWAGDRLLYVALPVMIMFLGGVVLAQATSFLLPLIHMMGQIGGM
jgi:type II secretory pathway component PulF